MVLERLGVFITITFYKVWTIMLLEILFKVITIDRNAWIKKLLENISIKTFI